MEENKIPVSVDNVPAEIQELLDKNVNFRELEDVLIAYRRLNEVKLFASNKGVSNFVDIEWSYFYEYHDSTEEDFKKLLELDEKYGIDNLIQLQDDLEDAE